MKRVVTLFLCLVMITGIFPVGAYAASSTLVFEEELAQDLKALGIFKGVSENDFALGRAPTRAEALVMLIRVLGKEDEAIAKGGKHPFLDVPEWADKYVGYAYENKLTNGISASKFGSNTEASSAMYITFILRALGYSDKNNEDFEWSNPYALAHQAGVMLGNPDTSNFLRADVVLVSYAALEAEIKGTKQTLAEKLISAGVFTAEEYEQHYDIDVFENINVVRELTSEEIYAQCSPAVFYIEVYDEIGNAFASGSGFFIKADGTAVTNYHVIEGAASAKIMCSNTGKIYNVEGVYDYSANQDWAVIKISGSGFPYLECDESELLGGSTVYAIGSPLGLDNTISQGLISNVCRVIDGVPYIQTSAAISNGSSGGALLNKYGKVVGITSAGFAEGQNLNLALPISIIKGYTYERAHPLTAIGMSENKPLGNVDLSGLSEEQAAYKLLKLWILNNANDTLGTYPAYSEKIEEDGESVTYSIAVDEAEDEMYLTNSYFDGESLLITRVLFACGDEQTIGYCSYYDSIFDDEAIASGYSILEKEQYSEDMYVSFDGYEGDYFLRSDCQEVAAATFVESLNFVDYIFYSSLFYYELDGARSLGFSNI